MIAACSTADTTPETTQKRGIGHGTLRTGKTQIMYLVGGASPKWKMRQLINEMIRVYESDYFAVSAVPYSQALLETSLRENISASDRATELKIELPFMKRRPVSLLRRRHAKKPWPDSLVGLVCCKTDQATSCRSHLEGTTS